MTIKLNVANCPKCGAVYDKNLRNLCPACSQELNTVLKKLDDHMWKHRTASTQQLSEATGIDVERIAAFVKEDRLRSKLYPNLTYPCEKCGSAIRSARLCLLCSNELRHAFQPGMPTREAVSAGRGFRIGERMKRS